MTKSYPSVFIETYGCQMNKSDSELIRGLLKSSGFRVSEGLENADIVLINSCSVRDHAEQRILGRIGVLSAWKKQAPHRRLGVLGCMAQRLGHTLAEMRPILDFVVGPDEYRTLADLLLDEVKRPAVHTSLHKEELYSGVMPHRNTKISGWVTISRGCGNYCSYCIVPFTRGPERCRPADAICGEIEAMAAQGFREITLLGQNVNSYNDGKTDGKMNFPGLLKRIGTGQIPGLLRIRFMTSHPKDLSDGLLEVMANEKRLCPHIHLPVQSGSSRILERMNRGYTREHYLDMIRRARELVPGVSLTTDVMVGFPGETEADFQDTLRLMEEVRFDEAFTYHYSTREGTAAAGLPDTVPDAVKFRRLSQLIGLQRRITLERKKEMIGRIVEVLPEKTSRRSSDEWMGKTPGNQVVIFRKCGIQAGEPVNVRIETIQGTTLKGSPLHSHINCLQTATEEMYVAV